MLSRNITRLTTRTLSLPFRRHLSTFPSPPQTSSISPRLVSLLITGITGITTTTLLIHSSHSDPSIPIPSIKQDIANAIENDASNRGDGTSIAPTLVRLAWHASGTYSCKDHTGGSNGATMRYSPEKDWDANKGLQVARDFLEPIKKKYPDISYADLWTLAGATAIEEMGGPKIAWRPGRSDSESPTRVPDGRLPSADKGTVSGDIAHLRNIFGRMGFTDKEIVALTGAHAVGRCHVEASGYWGPWTNAETTFSNEYFRLLLQEKWTFKKTHEGKKWTGPAQYENPNGTLMMLPVDISLASDPITKPYVEAYANDEEAFFNDFAAAFSKLLELGVEFPAPENAQPRGSSWSARYINRILGTNL